MDPFIKEIQHINNVEDAINKLNTQTEISQKLSEIINFVIEAHEGQYRKSGEPYCVHPILVASITAHFSKDEAIIATALLHDVVEDTEYRVSDIENMFGDKVAKIVDGLTKLSGDFDSRQALTLKKMLMTLSEDVRVVLIKIADRLHNMQTLESMYP